MQARIVIYSRSGHTRAVAQALAAQTGAEVSEVICPSYRGPFGWLRAQTDALRGVTPDITVCPAIGTADFLIVGGPIWRGRMAAPLRRFLSNPERLPPVAGVFVTRARIGSTAYLEADLDHVSGVLTPEFLSLKTAEIRAALDAPKGEGRLGVFLDRLMPLLKRSPVRPFIPANISI